MKQLVLQVAHDQAVWFEENLTIYDIDGIEIENDQDKAYTELNWFWDEAYVPAKQDSVLIKLFGSDEVLAEIASDVADKVLSIEYREIADENWNAKWMESFRGFPVGQKLYIQPVHDEPSPDRINLVIEAGMAFGTGTHETTMGCLEALEKYLKHGDQVIDVGSGSGILSIAAVKLGAKHVLAIEIDETALANAAENRQLNQVTDKIEQIAGDLLQSVTLTCQLMVANILPEVLVRMPQDASRLVEPNGYLILSGILNTRADEVLGYYHSSFELVESIVKGDWTTLVLKRRHA